VGQTDGRISVSLNAPTVGRGIISGRSCNWVDLFRSQFVCCEHAFSGASQCSVNSGGCVCEVCRGDRGNGKVDCGPEEGDQEQGERGESVSDSAVPTRATPERGTVPRPRTLPVSDAVLASIHAAV